MSSLVSIVCPTRDRLNCIARSMDYFCSCNEDIKYYIVDSSQDANAKQVVFAGKANLAEKANLIYYVHDPCMSSDFYIWMLKMVRTLSFISTPFVAVDSDDDFLDFEFVLQAASWLDNDPSISAITGVVRDFSLKPVDNKFDGSHLLLSSEGLYCSGRYNNQRSLTSCSAKSRVLSMYNIWPFEAVHRTKILRASFQVSISLGIDNYLGFLHVLRFMIAGYGKYIYLSDRVTTFRQDNTPASSGSYINNIFSSKYHYFCEDLAFQSFANGSVENIISSFCIRNEINSDFATSELLGFASVSLYKSLLLETIQSPSSGVLHTPVPKVEQRFFDNALAALFR